MKLANLRWTEIIVGLGALAAFLTYLESRRSRKDQAEIAHLDKQIKSLQLNNLQKQS